MNTCGSFRNGENAADFSPMATTIQTHCMTEAKVNHMKRQKVLVKNSMNIRK